MNAPSTMNQKPWTVLLVDDDSHVLDVTHMVLEDLEFDGRPLRILNANSAAEAMEIFRNENDIAVAIIDVVMENEHAGLDLVKFVRDHLANFETRLILRTGNPGAAPPLEIVRYLEIDDYKEKTELTAERLEITVITALRGYRNIKSSSSKGHFLSNMSHEIRTPLNAIIGLSTLALKYDSNERVINYLNKIKGAGRHLLGVVNDILDYSKIEAGKLQLERIDFDLDNLLLNAIAQVSETAKAKKLELVLDVEPAVNRRLLGDEQRLSQILLNLLSNAVKFTDKGQIEVRVKQDNQKNSKQLLRFEVADTGIGLLPAEQSLLFREFEQVDNSTSRKYGGTGLGLHISKNLAKMMGGDIGVQSEKGTGSTFWFTASLEQSAPQPSKSATHPGLAGRPVLVVDDNDATRKFLVLSLKQLGLAVTAVPNGLMAIDAVRQSLATDPYALIFMDWSMPELDGIKTAQAIRGLAGRNIQIVCTTGFGVEEVEAQAKQSEFDFILPKPVTQSQLFDVVTAALNLKPVQNPVSLPQEPQSEDAEESLSGLRVLLVEDNELNQEVARELLKTTGVDVDIAENGAVALERIRAQGYDLIFMDMQMPVMDGIAATREIRKLPEFANLPIVAMTANAQSVFRDRCFDAGMNDFIAKPIEPRILYQKLHHWLGGKRRSHPPASTTGIAATSLPDSIEPNQIVIAGLNTGEGLRLCGGRPQFYLTMLKRFLEQWSDAGTAMRNLTSEQRWEEATRFAHSLKGNAGSLGMEELRQAAFDLEQLLKQNPSETTGQLHTQPELSAALEQLERKLSPLQDGLKRVFQAPNN